jgi:hypothetical protein
MPTWAWFVVGALVGGAGVAGYGYYWVLKNVRPFG